MHQTSRNSIMFSMVLSLFLSAFYGRVLCRSTSSSWEHKIRADLLENYDKKVRPAVRGKKPVEVSFALRVGRLVKVDNKEQLVVLDTWVIQHWRNPFLTWNPSDYGGLDRIFFSPGEIWVPDIALYNNGDDNINLAGGPSKFVTDVVVDDRGMCRWGGPATFKVNCKMKIDQWPFDEQQCKLGFGSYTFGKNLLKLKLFKDKSKLTNRFVESGNWRIEEITSRLSETDHGNCCRFNFSEVEYTIKMKRKSLYYTFYVTIPCVILTILAFSSFLIHVESGERIGFVTTVLLAMTVFLLIIPSWLPVTSDGLPILGVLLEATMIIITLVLFANIWVLRVYFKEGKPPDWVERICCLCIRGRRQNIQQIHAQDAEGPLSKAEKPVASMVTIEMTGSNIDTTSATEHCHKKGDNHLTWQRVSTIMDRAFFVIFVLISLTSYAVYTADAL